MAQADAPGPFHLTRALVSCYGDTVSTQTIDANITITPLDVTADPAWRREWTIKFLRGEHDHGDHPESGKWTMSREDIERLLAVFEASGATAEVAEHLTCCLPESFCRKCLDEGGIHIGVGLDGKEFWTAGTAESVRKWSAEAMDSKVIVDADGNPHPGSIGGAA